jgi:hypothetical protein
VLAASGGHNVLMIGSPGTAEKVYRARTPDDEHAGARPASLQLAEILE